MFVTEVCSGGSHIGYDSRSRRRLFPMEAWAGGKQHCVMVEACNSVGLSVAEAGGWPHMVKLAWWRQEGGQAGGRKLVICHVDVVDNLRCM